MNRAQRRKFDRYAMKHGIAAAVAHFKPIGGAEAYQAIVEGLKRQKEAGHPYNRPDVEALNDKLDGQIEAIDAESSAEPKA